MTLIFFHGWQVERLEGDETDVFSLNSINQQLPSHPKAVVPLAQADLDSKSFLTIPYSYQTNRIAATNSRNYVFYASSPNADVLSPYLEYCADRANPDKLAKFGILFSSSYSMLRVYRVSAYRRCAAYSCGGDLVRFATFDGFSRSLGRECDASFNVSIRALEYLNEDNIAVTLESSPVTAWNVLTGSFTNASRTTYWLNPATMRVRRTVWQTDPASSGIPTQIPALCPAMQRLPRMGTFLAELLNAGVFLLKYVVYAITYTPGLVAVWSSSGGARCPAPGSAMYHSVLANCGERVYALDDFFDSLDDAGAVFWHGLSLVARLIAPASHPAVAKPITNVLDGMSQYGQGAVDVWAGGAGVLTLTRVPIREQAMQVCLSRPPRVFIPEFSFLGLGHRTSRNLGGRGADGGRPVLPRGGRAGLEPIRIQGVLHGGSGPAQALPGPAAGHHAVRCVHALLGGPLRPARRLHRDGDEPDAPGVRRDQGMLFLPCPV